jgi:hypothetical protein
MISLAKISPKLYLDAEKSEGCENFIPGYRSSRRHPARRADTMHASPIAQPARPRRYTRYTGQTPLEKEAFRRKLVCCFFSS